MQFEDQRTAWWKLFNRERKRYRERHGSESDAKARHRFVPPSLHRHSMRDRPPPIGLDQTISQTAYRHDGSADISKGEGAEIGTGGYQAAVLRNCQSSLYPSRSFQS